VGVTTEAVRRAIFVYGKGVTGITVGTRLVGFCESHDLGIVLSQYFIPFFSHHIA
jgi:hypothetical protein